MGFQKSFSYFEKKQLHKFRNDLNNAKDIVELSNVFALNVYDLLSEAVDFKIEDNDVTFAPSEKKFFKCSSNLLENQHFEALTECSDIENIIHRFAVATYDRYVKIQKNNSKTNKKIRA